MPALQVCTVNRRERTNVQPQPLPPTVGGPLELRKVRLLGKVCPACPAVACWGRWAGGAWPREPPACVADPRAAIHSLGLGAGHTSRVAMTAFWFIWFATPLNQCLG